VKVSDSLLADVAYVEGGKRTKEERYDHSSQKVANEQKSVMTKEVDCVPMKVIVLNTQQIANFIQDFFVKTGLCVLTCPERERDASNIY
jgi:hypothetical protein